MRRHPLLLLTGSVLALVLTPVLDAKAAGCNLTEARILLEQSIADTHLAIQYVGLLSGSDMPAAEKPDLTQVIGQYTAAVSAENLVLTQVQREINLVKGCQSVADLESETKAAQSDLNKGNEDLLGLFPAAPPTDAQQALQLSGYSNMLLGDVPSDF